MAGSRRRLRVRTELRFARSHVSRTFVRTCSARCVRTCPARLSARVPHVASARLFSTQRDRGTEATEEEIFLGAFVLEQTIRRDPWRRASTAVARAPALTTQRNRTRAVDSRTRVNAFERHRERSRPWAGSSTRCPRKDLLWPLSLCPSVLKINVRTQRAGHVRTQRAEHVRTNVRDTCGRNVRNTCTRNARNTCERNARNTCERNVRNTCRRSAKHVRTRERAKRKTILCAAPPSNEP